MAGGRPLWGSPAECRVQLLLWRLASYAVFLSSFLESCRPLPERTRSSSPASPYAGRSVTNSLNRQWSTLGDLHTVWCCWYAFENADGSQSDGGMYATSLVGIQSRLRTEFIFLLLSSMVHPISMDGTTPFSFDTICEKSITSPPWTDRFESPSSLALDFEIMPRGLYIL